MNQRGFSLMEIMMVCGLVGITSVAIMSLMDNVNTQMTTARIKTDAASFITSVQTTMKNSDSCKFTLQNAGVHMSGATTTVQDINHIAYYKANGTMDALLIGSSAGGPYTLPVGVPGNNMLEVKRMWLIKPGDTTESQPPILTSVASSNWAADLVIQFQQKNNVNISMKPYVISGLQIQTNAGTGVVQSCRVGSTEVCETAARKYGDATFAISSTDPNFTGAPSDIFSIDDGSIPTDPSVDTYWGLKCNVGWKMTACMASPFANLPTYTTYAAINNACVATTHQSQANTRIYLSCCSQ